MIIELAPMEGLTGYINRNALAHNFGGIDIFYTPFIPAAKKMSKKIKVDLDPENNKGIKLIPQIMSNRVDEVLYLGEQLKEYGYNTLNVNLGCPSGTVTSKKRGSGFLTVPDELDRFLDELYCKADITITLKNLFIKVFFLLLLSFIKSCFNCSCFSKYFIYSLMLLIILLYLCL